jgi:hypothetical protein
VDYSSLGAKIVFLDFPKRQNRFDGGFVSPFHISKPILCTNKPTVCKNIHGD